VRVHTDAPAAESAQAISALAYTVGRDVVFARGQYEPGTSQGQRLLAHELTHVLQQHRGGASAARLDRKQTDWPAWHEGMLTDLIALVNVTAKDSADVQWQWLRRYVCGIPKDRAVSLHARFNRGALAVPGNKDDFPQFVLLHFPSKYDDLVAMLDEIGAGKTLAACALPQPTPDPPPTTPGSQPAPAVTVVRPGCDTARLDAIEREARAIIADARADGHQVAADNLEHYLGNSGKTREIPVDWLHEFSAVVGAETTNRHRFEPQLSDKGDTMPEGEEAFTDYWDAGIAPFKTTELFYASGDSTLKSTGTFTLERDSTDHVVIHGLVTHEWVDRYDWNPGASTYIPGHGMVSDDDMQLLFLCGRANNFDLKSTWTQSLTAAIQVNAHWFNYESWLWGAPRPVTGK
jgi:hypothetical protein